MASPVGTRRRSPGASVHASSARRSSPAAPWVAYAGSGSGGPRCATRRTWSWSSGRSPGTRLRLLAAAGRRRLRLLRGVGEGLLAGEADLPGPVLADDLHE